MTIQYIKEYFVGDYDRSIEDTYTKRVEVDGKTYNLDILDSISEEYSALRDSYQKTGNAFVMVYDITDPGSFRVIPLLYDDLKECNKSNPLFVLVGNKCDDEKCRKVSTEEGKAMDEKFGNCLFFEASAKARINIEEIFQGLVKLLKDKEEKKE